MYVAKFAHGLLHVSYAYFLKWVLYRYKSRVLATLPRSTFLKTMKAVGANFSDTPLCRTRERCVIPDSCSIGELDPHGADGLGNPHGGLVFSSAFGSLRQAHEWTVWSTYLRYDSNMLKVLLELHGL